jgi:hypothetical protein
MDFQEFNRSSERRGFDGLGSSGKALPHDVRVPLWEGLQSQLANAKGPESDGLYLYRIVRLYDIIYLQWKVY